MHSNGYSPYSSLRTRFLSYEMGNLWFYDEAGSGHCVAGSFNGTHVKVGCFTLSTEAWKILKKQVDEALSCSDSKPDLAGLARSLESVASALKKL